jgi:hypothetical protein
LVLARRRSAGVGLGGQLCENSIELIGLNHRRVCEELQLLVTVSQWLLGSPGMLRGEAYILEYAERPDGHGGLELARHGGLNLSVRLKANFAVLGD